MDFTFLKATGQVAFYRSDAEQAEWTQEEMSLNCTFPLDNGKIIERGMVVLFQDPATNAWQAYEIRQCQVFPGDGYQQFTAECLAISELTDCHIQNTIELTDATIQTAMSKVLSGTGWKLGNVDNPPSDYMFVTQSADISRGSVWQAVCTIQNNWNAYVMPRVTVNASGISGRYIDIVYPGQTFRGLRLAVNKNVSDPSVIYDDTELYTALYGYGGTYSEGTLDEKVTLEYNFSSVSWSKTSNHPAKPKGQKYIEDPEATALYGRNGKPRFGYYQNVDIDDPSILLGKTWETLKQCNHPKISISGTVTDLKRLGYADVPLRLHDMAIVELEPIGVLFYKEVIQLTVNLLDPTGNLPTIGDYIPNIIYINRATEDVATGGSKGAGGRGGGGGRGGTKTDLAFSEWKTSIYDTGREVGMWARRTDEQGNILNQAGMHIDPITGVLIYAENNANMVGSKFHLQSNMIEAEVKARTQQGKELSSKITQTANAITLEVSERKGAIKGLNSKIDVQKDRISLVVSDGANPQIKPAAIVNSINQGQSSIRISADHIDIDGLVNDLTSYDINVEGLRAHQIFADGESEFSEGLNISGGLDCDDIACEDVNCDSMTFDDHSVSWKSKSVLTTVTLTDSKAFVYKSAGVEYTMLGKLVLGTTSDTIYYLGR